MSERTLIPLPKANPWYPASMRVEITEEIRERLESEAERTGVGASKLMRGRRKDMPEGLTSSMMTGWKIGSIGSAKKEHLDWVLKAYEDWTPPEETKRPERIKLSDAQVSHLQAEVERTGLGAVNILRHSREALPKGLNHQKVQRWINGQTRTAMKEHWNFVLALYASLSARN